jgi:predicted DNA-binding protein (UPF0251 family)
MIRMAEKESIRKKHFVEGWSIRKVSKMFEVSRQTVRKALKDSTVPVYRITKPRVFDNQKVDHPDNRIVYHLSL